jgi:hypothetical protein
LERWDEEHLDLLDCDFTIEEDEMEDKEWYKRIEDGINDLKERVKKLESGGHSCRCQQRMLKTLTLDIKWPEADIDGLHFNEQRIRGIFELKKDGNYYSRDILFLSARDTDEGTDRDLLSEYLSCEAVKEAFMAAIAPYFEPAESISVFLPEGTQGTKRYNGVSLWYWLKPRRCLSATHFCLILGDGDYASNGTASSVGGCAPAFRVGG